jgi:uncharacterized protein YndB with AHSA1/START domain
LKNQNFVGSKSFFYTLPHIFIFASVMAKRKNIRQTKEKKKSAKKKPVRAKQKSHAVKETAPQAQSVSNVKVLEPEHKLVLEYIIHASPNLLYEFLTTPSGLSEWFADDVNVNGNIYTFVWEGAKQHAEVISRREWKSIRFHWTDSPPNTYFEFKIEKNELTEELSLIITDFAESKEEKNSLEIFWQEQVTRLMKVIGSVV